MLALPFGPLVSARWIERRQRFLLDVALDDGRRLTAHCPNTGAMTGVGGPGARVLLSVSDRPTRRYAHTLEAVAVGRRLVGINTMNPNRVVGALARSGRLPFLPRKAAVKPEVRYGTAGRADFLVTGPDGARTFLEVKNVHLVEEPGLASFPDCVTVRGARHLEALSEVVRAGERAVMLFLVQRGDVERFTLARAIDPAYGRAFDRAVDAGVEMHVLVCNVTRRGIAAKRFVPLLDLASPAPSLCSDLPIPPTGTTLVSTPAPTDQHDRLHRRRSRAKPQHRTDPPLRV